MIPNSPGVGQVSVLVLGGFVLLAIPAGLSLGQGLTGSSHATDAVLTPTLPPTDLTPTDTATPSATDTPRNPAPIPTPTQTVGNESRTHVVGAPDEADCEPPDHLTIQDAVDHAEPGDRVLVCAGTYAGNVTVGTPNITIEATGNATVAAGPLSAFNVSAPDVTIDGFDVQTTDGVGIWVAGDRGVIRDNTLRSSKDGGSSLDDDGIKLVQVNRTLVSNNTISGFPDDGVSVGEDSDSRKHGAFDAPFDDRGNESHHNRIISNTQSGLPGYSHAGIYVGTQAAKTLVRNNTVTDNQWHAASYYTPLRLRLGGGIQTRGHQTLIAGNTALRNTWLGIRVYANGTRVVNNTVRYGYFGIQARGRAAIIGNTVQNTYQYAVWLTSMTVVNPARRVVENRLTNNRGDAINLYPQNNVSNTEIHRNVILNNDRTGISHSNSNKTDGYWPIVNATNNIWGCGGPSSGLEDPYTGRSANGNGDQISAGDEPGVSNIHFDPYQVRNPAACPGSPKTTPDEPTPTPTTPTMTPSPTVSPTPTPTPPTGSGGGTDAGGDGPGSGAIDDWGNTTGDTGAGARTPVTPPPTPTALPTPTLSPNPVVEPGFGVVAWTVGVVLGIAVVVVTHRPPSRRTRGDD